MLAYTLGIPDPEDSGRWQVALDSAGHGLWDWDIAANRIFRSESWLAMLGYTADDVPDANLESALALVHPDDQAMVRQRMEAYVAGQTGNFLAELRINDGHGHWIWVRARGRADRSRSRMAPEGNTSWMFSSGRRPA